MTYHSPGRPRSSSRRAVTASTGSAGFGLFLVVLVALGFGVGLRGLFLFLGVQGGLLGGLTCGGVGSFGLVRLLGVRRLDDVELVLGGLEGARRRLDGVVQVRVRHGGCFFLDTNGWNMRKGRP